MRLLPESARWTCNFCGLSVGLGSGAAVLELDAIERKVADLVAAHEPRCPVWPKQERE